MLELPQVCFERGAVGEWFLSEDPGPRRGRCNANGGLKRDNYVQNTGCVVGRIADFARSFQ